MSIRKEPGFWTATIPLELVNPAPDPEDTEAAERLAQALKREEERG